MNTSFACDEILGSNDCMLYFYPMKISVLKSYNHFVLLIWVMLWLNFLFQYVRYSPFLEAFSASLCITVFAYPPTTWLSTTLLRRAMAERKMGIFLIQFFLLSVLITGWLLLCVQIFMYLEKNGTFQGSTLFSELASPVKEILNTFLVSLFINFGFCGLRFYEESIRLQKELTDSQMEILKGQINPHFMFNVLNHIHVLMQKDVSLASSLLLQYSDILRYQLYNGKQEEVTVNQEVEFLKNYIEVEKLRWKGKLEVITRWEIANGGCQLPPLLLITFVENAFKHVSRTDSERGYVTIRLKQEGDMLRLQVENSKSKIKDQPGTGIGLDNIRRRLDILFPGSYELNIGDKESIFEVELVIRGIKNEK